MMTTGMHLVSGPVSLVWACSFIPVPLLDKYDSITFGSCNKPVCEDKSHQALYLIRPLTFSGPADVFCVSCCNCVGWRYEFAFEKSQKYKENKVTSGIIG